MKFYTFTSAASMARAELVNFKLFGLGHQTTLPYSECYQVDRAALAAADALIILLTATTDAEEVLRCALAAGKPVLLWRDPSAQRIDLELAGHRLVFENGGDLADARSLQMVAVVASEMASNFAAGRFGQGEYGHASAIAARFGGGPSA